MTAPEPSSPPAPRLPPVLREVNWFVVIGLAATACHAGATLAAQRFLGLGPLGASGVGYLCSVGISYVGNSLLTFRSRVMHGPQFVRFLTISLAGLAVNAAIVFVCTHLLGWPLKLALIPVVIIVPGSTFVLAKFWAFRGRAPAAGQGSRAPGRG